MARLATLAVLTAVLAPMAGCGENAVPVDPDGGEKLKQARINAYGKSGSAPTTGASVNAQAAARQKGGR